MADRADALSRPATAGKAGLVVFTAVLAVAELAWFRWFLSEPLPNAANIGGVVWRSLFLWRGLPHIVPGVRWADSYLGAAWAELSHPENLPERLPIVLAAALIAGAAVALGRLVLHALGALASLDRLERLALAYPAGAAALGVLAMLAGRLGALSTLSVRAALGLVIVAEVVRTLRRGPVAPPPPRPEERAWPAPARGLALLVMGLFLVLMALAALLPTIDFDALEYHLQGPKEYFLAGRIAFLPHNVYTSMPFGVEMLHLLGMFALDDWWRGALAGQLLVMAFAPAAAVLVARVAAGLASGRAGWVAALVYLTTPWIYRLAAIPYVEGPLAAYHAALLFVAARIAKRRAPRGALAFALLGWLAGGAMACKYPALISAVLPFGLVAALGALRERSAGVLLAFAAGMALTIGPWLAKNLVETGNPVYPLGYAVFGGRDWDAAREAKWSHAHGRRPIAWAPLRDGLLDVAGRSDWQSPLYTALAPLALLRRGSRRGVLALWGYVAYLFATWWLLTHRLDRFWLPLLPPLAILAGVGADWVRSRLWNALLAVMLVVSILVNLVDVSTALAGLNQWTDSYARLRSEVPRMLNPPLARLDAELPPGAVPLLVGQASVFHLNHRVVYNTVFDREILETIARGRPPEAVGRELHRRGITHVYVDWSEIDRHRKPGGYGFTDFITPELLAGLAAQGVLEPMERPGPRQDLYRVR